MICIHLEEINIYSKWYMVKSNIVSQFIIILFLLFNFYLVKTIRKIRKKCTLDTRLKTPYMLFCSFYKTMKTR